MKTTKNFHLLLFLFALYTYVIKTVDVCDASCATCTAVTGVHSGSACDSCSSPAYTAITGPAACAIDTSTTFVEAAVLSSAAVSGSATVVTIDSITMNSVIYTSGFISTFSTVNSISAWDFLDTFTNNVFTIQVSGLGTNHYSVKVRAAISFTNIG